MIYVNGFEVVFHKFPNGESRLVSNLNVHGDKNSLISFYKNTVTFKYEDDSDITKLVLVTEQVMRVKAPSELIITHMPYARMDRSDNGEPLFLRTVANIINSLGFDVVKVIEPHSDVTTALLKDAYSLPLTKELFNRSVGDLFEFDNEKDYLVFPDTTADRRYWDINKEIKNRIVFNKHRDFGTGRIVELTTDFKGYFNSPRTAVILDDMSSYGGTFIRVAKSLRSFGFDNIILIVAHAENSIFSGDIFKTDLIDKVITTNTVMTQHREPHNLLITNSDRIKIFNFNEILS